jgi:hypothetical protein
MFKYNIMHLDSLQFKRSWFDAQKVCRTNGWSLGVLTESAFENDVIRAKIGLKYKEYKKRCRVNA